MPLLMWMLSPVVIAVASSVGILGVRKRRLSWIFWSVGGHSGFLLGVLLVVIFFITNGATYLTLVHVDLIGRLICGPAICEAYGFPYILTSPASLSLYGSAIALVARSLRLRANADQRAKLAVPGTGRNLVILLSILNFTVAIAPFAVLVAPQLVQAYRESRIIHSIITRRASKSACEDIAVYSGTCYAVAAITYQDEGICEDVYAPFPQFNERFRKTCRDLVREAKEGLLTRESCTSPRVSAQGYECFVYLGVYLQDPDLCAADAYAECAIYINWP